MIQCNKIIVNKIKLITIIRGHLFITLLLLFFSSIFLVNLSGQDYSGDETGTLFVARTILKYGFPSAWDGQMLLSLSNGADFTKIGDFYLWNWHPWLQFYITFLGIFFWGDSVEGTRMPFALFGVFTVIILYFTAHELFKNKFISFMISMHLIFLLPFFLYVRNVRYYSLGAFFSILTIYLLIRYRKNKWSLTSTIILFLSTFLLFHTNYIIWVSTLFLLIISWLIKKNRSLLIIILFEIVFGAIWYLIFKPFGGNVGISSNFGWEFAKNIGHYFSYTNNYLFPLILFPFVYAVLRSSKSSLKSSTILLSFVIAIKLFFYSIFLYAHGRYLVELAPIFLLFYGFIYKYLLEKKLAIVCLLFFLVTITTNILNLAIYAPLRPSQSKIEFWLPKYSIELTKKYKSIYPVLGKYFQEKYKPGDLIWSQDISYNYTKAPSLSYVKDAKTGSIINPAGVRNPDKTRWFVYFGSEELFYKNLSSSPYYGKEWKNKIKKNYNKLKFKYNNNLYSINDGDVFNRHYPPLKFSQDIFIFEKKEDKI